MTDDATAAAPFECLVRPLTAPRLKQLELHDPGTCTIDEVRRMAGEIMWLRSQVASRGPIDVTRPGTAVLIYTDDGPKGPCGQSLLVTHPKTQVHVFRTEAELRRWAKANETALTSGSRSRVRVVVVGDDQIGTTLEIHD